MQWFKSVPPENIRSTCTVGDYVKHRIFNSSDKWTPPGVKLIIPYPGLLTYGNECSFWKELLYPEGNVFTKLDTLELYKHWNGHVIVDFKWNRFASSYYYGIWAFYIAFLLCFAVATTTELDQLHDDARKSLLIITIIFGFIHLNFEIRQFIWNPRKYIADFWNFFGMIFMIWN